MKSKKRLGLWEQAQTIFPQLQKWRRQIHQHPELGFKEIRTSALVAKVLKAAGWEVTAGVAETGVVGLLRGASKGRTFAIRADMDALPIEEANRTSYRSRVSGVMHACGHDGNTSMALGAAVLLARQRARIAGQVKLVFQPCEERPPGGAQAMIRAGVLQHPKVSAVVAAHIDSSLPVGKIALRSGVVMAAADMFSLTICGRAGHGAFPHHSLDAVAIAGEVIVALQQIVSREVDPLEPAVVTLGEVHGGTTFNVIAETVTLRGTLRSLNPALRRMLVRRVASVAKNVCRAHRAQCRFILEPGHPALYNHAGITAMVRVAVKQVAGINGVMELDRPMMTGEDFTYFAAAVPACFFRVGGRNAAKGFVTGWHHPAFDFDETGMVTGTAVLVQTALSFLAA